MSKADSIAAKIKQLGDWRADTLARLRALIKEADPDVVEELKWKKPTNPAGVPTWSHDGVICTGDGFKGKVKLTFAKGAKLDDPHRVFNNGLGGNAMRAIDLKEGEWVNEEAFQNLIRAAVALNQAKTR